MGQSKRSKSAPSFETYTILYNLQWHAESTPGVDSESRPEAQSQDRDGYDSNTQAEYTTSGHLSHEEEVEEMRASVARACLRQSPEASPAEASPAAGSACFHLRA